MTNADLEEIVLILKDNYRGDLAEKVRNLRVTAEAQQRALKCLIRAAEHTTHGGVR